MKSLQCMLLRRLSWLCLLFIAMTLTPSVGLGQQDDDPVGNVQDRKLPETYTELRREMRENESSINRLYSTMPVGFPERKQLFTEKISQLKARNELLETKVKELAVRSFSADPGNNASAARVIYNELLRNIEPRSLNDVFSPEEGIKLVELMLQSYGEPKNWPRGINQANVLYQGFRGNFAVEQFDQAGKLLDQIESMGIRLQPEARQKLAYCRQKWQQELQIREAEANADDLPRVKLETTEGDIIVELFENHAPQTVANFIHLVESGFYDDLQFFQVRPGGYVRAGCSKGDGTSDPGYQVPNELDREQIRYHFSGTLSMRNDGEAGVAGAQFFITHQPYPRFDKQHTAFGRVIEGMPALRKLKTADMTITPSFGSPSRIVKAAVLRKRDHKYEPNRIEGGDQ